MNQNQILRIVSVAIVAATVLVFLLWNAGVLSLPFLPSPITPPAETESGETGEESLPAEEESNKTEESGPSASSPSDQTEPLPVFPRAEDLLTQGATRTQEQFDASGMVIAKLTVTDKIASLGETAGNQTVKKLVRKETSQSGITIVSRTEQEPILSITPYLGYLFAYGEGKTYLLNKNGAVLNESFPSVTLVYAKDNQGRPVVEQNGAYYAITASGALASTDFSPVPNMIYADAPAPKTTKYPTPFSTKVPIFTPLASTTQGGSRLYTETQKTQILSSWHEKVQALSPSSPAPEDGSEALYTMKEEIRWGYKDKNGNVVIQPIYIAVLPFGADGYGPVVVYNKLLNANVLIFINASGNKMIDITGRYYKDYTVNDADVYEGWFPALTTDSASLGSYYFDGGYARVRQRMLITHQIGRAYLDREVLINKKGEVLELPEGYNLISYSCGIMLLEKNGRYGYMDTERNWVAQPLFTDAEPFYCGLAVVKQNGKYGVIDKNGDFVLPPRYDAISHASEGLFTAYTEQGGWQVLCTMKK